MDLTPVRSQEYLQKTPLRTLSVLTPRPVWGWAQCFSLDNGHLDSMSLGVAQLIKVPASFVFANKRYNLFCAVVLGLRYLRSPRTHFPLTVCDATCLWNIFFPTSEINEISISHLTQSDYASSSLPPPINK